MKRKDELCLSFSMFTLYDDASFLLGAISIFLLKIQDNRSHNIFFFLPDLSSQKTSAELPWALQKPRTDVASNQSNQ
jgi:hypothetical protein